MSPNRKFAIAAAALLLAGATGAAFAHPHPEGEGDGKTVERVVIIRDGKGGEHRAGAADDRRVPRFEIHGSGLADCDGGEKIVDESAGDGERKTKVVICTRGAPSGATAEHLEEALARIRTNDNLSDEQKAKIETALKSAIDRARSAR
jgi:rhodanese-related sulfurtransferase